MNKILVILTAAVLIFTGTACNKTDSDKIQPSDKEKMELSVYQKAGVVKVKDPKAVMVGYRKPGDDIFEISLDDVGKYTGHVCAGVSSGFLLVKNALEKLYPGGEIPVRGSICITASEHSDHLEVAAYVVRASFDKSEEGEKNYIIIDTTLKTSPEVITIIFKRNDTGKMVKADFDKSKLMTPEKMKEMIALKKKIMEGVATSEEKSKFAEKVQREVYKIINDTPEYLITVSECTDYDFKSLPEIKK